jgi:hypothetical protein
MIDTVRIAWPHATYHQPTPPAGWEVSSFTHTKRADTGLADDRHGIRYHHLATGLTASGSPHELKTVQFSMPRLLFGTNAKLIKSQSELDLAMHIAGHLLRQIGEPVGGIDRYTRVDLVWQFRIDPKLAILAHRHSRHLRIRRDSCCYEGQSLHWVGRGLHIRMYDKTLEMTRKPGDVLRVELELHGRLLKHLLAPGDTKLAHLDFDRAYAAYLELMLGFMPENVPLVSDIAELLVIAEAAGASYCNLSFFEIWAQGKNPEHVRRVQKQMAALRPRYFALDWARLLPDGGPPPAVELA